MNLSKILIGGLRFKNRENAAEIIHKAVAAGFNYIDTAPKYCLKNEKENSETWIGDAIESASCREHVYLSSKSSVSDGSFKLTGLNMEKGFGIIDAKSLEAVFKQSLKRMKTDSLDFYHLWAVNTLEQFNLAMEKEGWHDGIKKLSELWRFLGITSHADSDTCIKILESGLFSVITIPLNALNRSRLKVVEYCTRHNIPVIAMNPFAGGLLAVNPEIRDLSLLYLLKLKNVYPLIGFSCTEDVEYAEQLMKKEPGIEIGSEEIIEKLSSMIDTETPRCTGCGYCMPCPKNINLGEVFSYYNAYTYLGIKEAKEIFLQKQWYEPIQLKNCIFCGACAKRCPNALPTLDLIKKAIKTLYGE